MRRRDFITVVCGIAAFPHATTAQQSSQPKQIPVIGYLAPTSESGGALYTAAVRARLAEIGYIEGQTVKIEYRWANDQNDRLPALARELVNLRAQVIITSAIRASMAAKQATSTVPIVFATANDPVKFGLVTSLNRPVGNVTGIMYLSAALGEKRLELLHQLVPAATTIFILVNPANANAEPNLRNADTAAHALGLQTVALSASTEKEIIDALARAATTKAGAIVMLNDPIFLDYRKLIVEAVAKSATPMMYYQREFAEMGGLVSYGPSIPDAYRQAGVYAGRILNGTKPETLPVLQPAKFEFVINAKAARALGLTIPSSLVAVADEVIE